jgi:sugar phosphate isomerase/epimerase
VVVHPRISVNSISSLRQPFEDDLALWSELGVTHVGLTSPKLDAAGWDLSRTAVLDAGLRVSSLSAFREEPIDWGFARAVGCGVVSTVSGGGGTVRWEDAAATFCAEMAPFAARAADAAVRVAVEPTNPLRSDVSFVHSVRDATDLARAAGIGVVVDFYSSWYERGLAETLRENIDLVAIVQICDYKLGTYDMPNRCAIGDGDLPVEQLLTMVLDAGYEGPFDLEIVGPVIEAEGYRDPIRRSIERAGDMLERLGA